MKHYNSIDLLKFLMSFFVIAIHTAYDQVLLMRLICPWIVPMFFVISGFLLQRRISMQRPVEVCGKHVEKVGKALHLMDTALLATDFLRFVYS